jgi:hypothetical protein
MGDTAFLAVMVAAIAVIVNAATSIFLHFRRASFEEALAAKKFDFDVSLAERKATFDYLSAHHQRKQKVAGEILTAFYEVQRTMPAIRSPVSWSTEGQSRPRPEQGERAEFEKTRNTYYVVIERITKHREVIGRFLGYQFTAMALLGLDAGKPFEDFNQLINRISGSASMLIRTAEVENPPPSTRQWHADIWEGYGDAGEDRVQTDLNRIAEAVEAMCKPVLTAKSPVLSNVSRG